MNHNEPVTPVAVDALLLVDVQVGFVSGPRAVPAANELLPTIAALLNRARQAGALVVQLQNDGPAGGPDEPETATWQLQFPPLTGEPVVRKQLDDGFDGTDLGAILARYRAGRIAICGVLSEMCVSATARTALARGYGVVLPHDAHATYDVPATVGSDDAVPAALAARAAEWALGDEVELPATGGDVVFRAVSAPDGCRTP